MTRSDDGGATFTSSKLNLPAGEHAYIGAVDPVDPDVVYLRKRCSMPGPDAHGRVLVTRDGAATWQEVWNGRGDVAGFALSPDGTKLAVGGPMEGVHLAITLDFAFRRVSDVGAQCLTWLSAGLFACADEGTYGFSIGQSQDEGLTFAPVLHFADILPHDCPVGSPGASCLAAWSTVAPALGIDAGVVYARPSGQESADGAATEPTASGAGGCGMARHHRSSSVLLLRCWPFCAFPGGAAPGGARFFINSDPFPFAVQEHRRNPHEVAHMRQGSHKVGSRNGWGFMVVGSLSFAMSCGGNPSLVDWRRKPSDNTRAGLIPSVDGQWGSLISIFRSFRFIRACCRRATSFSGIAARRTFRVTRRRVFGIRRRERSPRRRTLVSSFSAAAIPLLADGRVLVSGGHDMFDGVGLRSTFAYDATSNTWTRFADMNDGRWYPTNTTLGNGDVLVVGGSIGDPGNQPDSAGLATGHPPTFGAISRTPHTSGTSSIP